jgi:hypothetical protein
MSPATREPRGSDQALWGRNITIGDTDPDLSPTDNVLRYNERTGISPPGVKYFVSLAMIQYGVYES